MDGISRRGFLTGAAAMGVAAWGGRRAFGFAGAQRFKVAVITDEISQDFDHACAVASKEFGMQWVELRGMWKKSLQALTDAEIAEAMKIQVQPAGDRYCEPAVQGGLAGRAAVGE